MTKIMMASDLPSKYTWQDAREDAKVRRQVAYQESVNAWLRLRPEVGTLNSGKFYVYPVGGEYKEIEAFSMYT